MRFQQRMKQEEVASKATKSIIKRIIICLFIGIVLFLALTFNKTFKLEKIMIKGNVHYTEEEIVRFLEVDRYHNTLLYYLSVRKKDFTHIPFIEAVDIRLTSFNDIQVEVFEKQVIGCIDFMGMYLYFDKDGIIVESLGYQTEDIPIIYGLNFKSMVLYEPLPVDDKEIFGVLLNLMQLLEKNNITINSITINEVQEFTLVKGNIRILIGTSSDLNWKINELKNILPTLENEKGELYIKHIDHSIYFKKDV